MDVYWNIFTMHGSMNVKFPNNTNKWQMEFNSAFKGLNQNQIYIYIYIYIYMYICMYVCVCVCVFRIGMHFYAGVLTKRCQETCVCEKTRLGES
jgi:hypothetical protein